jgi:hypothetical protein
MPTFDWQLSDAEADRVDWRPEEHWPVLQARYATATDAVGVDEWTAFVARIRESAQQPQTREWHTEIRSYLASLIQQLHVKSMPKQPTVFVSHQRRDAGWAEWSAWAATEAHFDYWLDIHDPTLIKANALVLPPPVKSILVAGIIEMALLNSTHVVSMQTMAQTSRWVPYEFGRAKERRSLATNAASWFETGVTPAANGDYLWLAYCASTSAALKTWLDATGRTPPPRPNTRWHKPLPGPLPN